MAYASLRDFIARLEAAGRLVRVTEPVSPALEMTEIQTRLLAEGGPAVIFENVVRADGSREVVPSKQTIHLNKNDHIIMWTAGGGGYGDPLERPAEQVLSDVLDLKVSLAAAREDYGVVIEDEAVLAEETERRRARLRTDRPSMDPPGAAC